MVSAVMKKFIEKEKKTNDLKDIKVHMEIVLKLGKGMVCGMKETYKKIITRELKKKHLIKRIT